jgi:menaquinone-specific isochorismate synthase
MINLDWDQFAKSGAIIRINENEVLIGWGNRLWMDKPHPSFYKPQFFFPDFFFNNKQLCFEHENFAVLTLEHLLSVLSKAPLTPAKNFNWKNDFKDLFFENVRNLQSLFKDNVLVKAVPYAFEHSSVSFTQQDLLRSLKNLVQSVSNQKLHLYGFWDQKQGILGATPEILFKYNGTDRQSHLETIACAGTLPSDGDLDSFINDSKEGYEHQLVVDGISQSLKPYGEVFNGKRQVLKLATLSHLITPITVHLKNQLDFQEVTKALHPTPALGAFPKEVGMQWLRQYQLSVPRERFGAPVGCYYEEGKKLISLVAIRNVQWDTNGSKICAGCGVVPESKVEKEWQEIELKIRSVKAMMGL